MVCRFRPPTKEEIRELSEELHFDLTEEEIEFFREMATERIGSYETVRSYNPDPKIGGPEVREQGSGRRPPTDENVNDTWVTRCEVRGVEGARSTAGRSRSRTTSQSPASR